MAASGLLLLPAKLWKSHSPWAPRFPLLAVAEQESGGCSWLPSSHSWLLKVCKSRAIDTSRETMRVKHSETGEKCPPGSQLPTAYSALSWADEGHS